ncbi:MAG TPA: hypothetical protein VMT58_04600 [Candidatus Binataceae bacterium]|nr:hypothetical protein [Candidatus Binataceae bacterium]
MNTGTFFDRGKSIRGNPPTNPVWQGATHSQIAGRYKIALSTVIAVAGVAAMLVVKPAIAASKCQWGGSFSGDMRCFVTQFPCNDIYFGIGTAPDYPKALKCFEANKRWPFVVLMYLDGEGAPRDLAKAESILKSGQKTDPDTFQDGEAEALQKAIDACKAAPQKPCPQIDYCKDLAQTNLEIQICKAIDQIFAQTALDKTMAAVESKLDAADRAQFRQAVAAFKAYQLAERDRAYLANSDGTMAGIASMDQAALVRDNFLKLVANTVETRKLAPADWNAYNNAGLEIKQAADKSIDDYTQEWHDDMGDPNMKDGLKQAKKEIADYKKSVLDSQRKWMNFCNLFAQLANRLYSNQAKSLDPAMSIKTAMAKMRIAELSYSAFGEN